MTGPPEGSGPPDHVEIGGPDDLDEFLAGRTPDHVNVRFRQDDESVEEQFENIDRSRGSGLAELQREDGSYVTVNVQRELDAIEVVG